MPFPHPFYFLRHGETGWNREGRTQGQTDSLLNETGRAQAQRAAQALKDEPIERIVSSPLSRARDTAEAVAQLLGLDVSTDPGLMECHLGDHQGEVHGPWLREYFLGNYVPPNGEHFDDFCARTWAAMQRAVAQGPNTLIVAHGGLWVSARRHVAVDPDLSKMPNALPLHIEPEPGRWRHHILGGLEWKPASGAV
ncbi:MAG TPA: histidine phosphatase family protein [Thermohalobaculum sp.]|nr:histidine phosphatase family protein [Thermohalobaculum sp.]